MNKIKATYGSFNMDMQPLEVIDATASILPFFKEGRLTVPKNLDFGKTFGIINSYGDKFLQFKFDEQTFNVLDDQYPNDIEINLSERKKIKIVYYLYFNPNSNWRAFISSQLMQLKSYGILNEADLYIHISDCYALSNLAIHLIKEIVPNCIISLNYENLFEYPGIKLIHDLSNQYPEDTFIYFHAKGIGHNTHSRDQKEIALFETTFKNWRKNIQILHQQNKNKVGVFPGKISPATKNEIARSGWIWYNYWYAKGDYLSNCETPRANADRYYYEGWLSLYKNATNSDDCISLYGVDGVNYFEPTEADFHLQFLTRKQLTFFKRVILAFGNKKIAYYYFKAFLTYTKWLKNN